MVLPRKNKNVYPNQKILTTSLTTLLGTHLPSISSNNKKFSPTLVIRSPFTQIDINLSIEEALLRCVPFQKNSTLSTRILFMYCNSPCVVLGRHQNVWAECNISKCLFNNNNENAAAPVQIQRRHSGGGTVYHDSGTLCMSFLTHKESYNPTSNMEWLADSLRAGGWISSNMKTTIGHRRDDLFVDDKKISGSAMRLTSRAAYHHCTLLVNSDLSNVRSFLKPNSNMKFPFLKNKSTSSVRSPVTSLQELCCSSNNEITTNVSCANVADFLEESFLIHRNKSNKNNKQQRKEQHEIQEEENLITTIDIDTEEFEEKHSKFSPNERFFHPITGSFELDEVLPPSHSHKRKTQNNTKNDTNTNTNTEQRKRKIFTLGEIHSHLVDKKFNYGSTPGFIVEHEFQFELSNLLLNNDNSNNNIKLFKTKTKIEIDRGKIVKSEFISSSCENNNKNDDHNHAHKKLESDDHDNEIIIETAFQKLIQETVTSGLFDQCIYEHHPNSSSSSSSYFCSFSHETENPINIRIDALNHLIDQVTATSYVALVDRVLSHEESETVRHILFGENFDHHHHGREEEMKLLKERFVKPLLSSFVAWI